MNYPVWELEMGGGLLIALVAVTHVFVSHFAVGGGLFLVVTEGRAYRTGDAALLGWLRRHSRFFAFLTLVFGAVTGVGIWFTIGLVHPAATSALIHIFVWGWAIEWVFFVIEIAAALLYQMSWDRVDRRTHLAIGWIYFAAAFLSLVVINGILSFMLTPGRWLETRSFLDGFLNPTYWPSLLVRTLAAIAFAGLYVFATAWREEPALRVRLARLGAIWALPATVAGPAAAWLYMKAVGPLASEAVQGAMPRAAHAFRMVAVAAVAYSILLAVVALLARRAPRLVSLPTGIALLALGYSSIAGAEWTRESLRKPYVIGNPASGYMYVNGLRPADLEATRRAGLLALARWGDSEAIAGETRARGAEVFRLACRGCHTVSGYNSIRRFVDGKLVAAIETAIRTLERRPGRMPPFPGSAPEAHALAVYLGGLDGVLEPEPMPADGDALARGKKTMESFCLSCHALDGGPADNPLRPKIRGWSEAEAYEKIGRLPQLNPAMLEFDGTDEDRRALAAYLADLATRRGE